MILCGIDEEDLGERLVDWMGKLSKYEKEHNGNS